MKINAFGDSRPRIELGNTVQNLYLCATGLVKGSEVQAVRELRDRTINRENTSKTADELVAMWNPDNLRDP